MSRASLRPTAAASTCMLHRARACPAAVYDPPLPMLFSYDIRWSQAAQQLRHVCCCARCCMLQADQHLCNMVTRPTSSVHRTASQRRSHHVSCLAACLARAGQSDSPAVSDMQGRKKHMLQAPMYLCWGRSVLRHNAIPIGGSKRATPHFVLLMPAALAAHSASAICRLWSRLSTSSRLVHIGSRWKLVGSIC